MQASTTENLEQKLIEENEKLLKQLYDIQESIDQQNSMAEAIENDTKKLKLMLPFAQLFTNCSVKEPSEPVKYARNILNELKRIREAIAEESEDIQKLENEKASLKEYEAQLNKDLEPFQEKPVGNISPRKTIMQEIKESKKKTVKGYNYKTIHGNKT
ncbi:unnamed protein product [Blepharisma stoltei]|uniref:Uncharacterized protein n=1 Tax=Blepharisma stoltei TaxID=1481888 RepID=A0AAU9I5I3_9CILI|nr:unnamed protein product [Blepharisma stoltei]